jgi:hypothetical protein
MLLSLRDQEGTVEFGAWYQQAIAGAILAELLLGRRIAVEEGRKKLANVVSDEPFGEPVIDECLDKMAHAKRRTTLQNWVQRFSGLRRLKHRVAAGLCERDILRADEDKVLLIFRRKVYPEINPRPERQLIERLGKAIFSDSPRVEPRTAILVSLANSAGLLKVPFGRKELKRRKKRIEQLAQGELMGKAAADAIAAAQAAVLVACIIPAMTISSHCFPDGRCR